MNRIFVTGIGTGIGKTLVSALLVEALGGEYWKPIQAGNLEHTDTHLVRSWVRNPSAAFHPESYRLKVPASPNIAAEKDGIRIDLASIKAPQHRGPLIIEGAGGLLVPLNDTALVADLAKSLDAGVLLVSRNYLGSINHTLLTAEALKFRELNVLGIVFNGPSYPEGEEIILRLSGLRRLFSVGEQSDLSAEAIGRLAAELPIKETLVPR